MKRLIEFYRQLRSVTTIKVSKHPIFTTVLMLIAINVAVIFAAAGISMAINAPQFGKYFSAVAQAVKWLVLPGSVLNETDAGIFVVAVCVAIVGMILFTGTVIAITTNYLRTYINQKTDGKGKLPLTNHIVILNYNSQVLAILADLMHDGTNDTVIILSNQSKDFVRAELAGEIAAMRDKPNSKLNLIVRKGNPMSVAELEEINIEKAKGILIMDDEAATRIESDISTADYETIKLVLRLSKFDIPSSCPIAVEAESDKTAKMIRNLQVTMNGLKEKSIEVFSYNKKLGQFLALAILCPPITNVLYDLLSFTGCLFYSVGLMPIEKYLHKYTGSIPIYTYDKTYVLSESVKHLQEQRLKPYNTQRQLKPIAIEPVEKPLNLFVIGTNKKAEYMFEALKRQIRPINIKTYSSTEREKFIDGLSEQHEGETIAVLLSEDTLETANRDENIFLTLAEINGKFGIENRPFKIIAEILEPNNHDNIVQFNILNIIVSSRVISFLATKLITAPGCDKFYEEIFTHSLISDDSKFSLCINEAGKLFDFTKKLTFHSYAELVMAVYHGSNAQMMPLGVIRGNETIYFCTDMDKNESFHLHEDDQLIYIHYHS